MNKQRDILFNIGLGVQLLLIPLAFLWRFSQEANYYNVVITIAFVLIIALFWWPQAIEVRAKRLTAIKIQLAAVSMMLILSWGAYAYFHGYHASHMPFPVYSVNWQSVFGARWTMVLQPGIHIRTALYLSIICIALPLANVYRYQLDKKRIKGLKKEDLFL